jgi:hypothetical protein
MRANVSRQQLTFGPVERLKPRNFWIDERIVIAHVIIIISIRIRMERCAKRKRLKYGLDCKYISTIHG